MKLNPRTSVLSAVLSLQNSEQEMQETPPPTERTAQRVQPNASEGLGEAITRLLPLVNVPARG